MNFKNGRELLELCEKNNCPISEIMLRRECAETSRTEQEIIKIFEESKALLTGHFQLRSGKHSNRFFQAALLLQYPDKAEKLCAVKAS